jgi:hypothetical protein
MTLLARTTPVVLYPYMLLLKRRRDQPDLELGNEFNLQNDMHDLSGVIIWGWDG